MTTRRQFLRVGAIGAIAPSFALAQARPVRVGMLSAIAKSFFAPAVLERLRELGYREGSTMALEFRSADGKLERFSPLAEELLKLNCDLIFAIGSEQAARALRGPRSGVPVVFLAIDYDPLEKGIVDSLVRPGGNMTGVYSREKETVLKRLEIANEVLPRASHFLVLADIYNVGHLEMLRKAAEVRQTKLTVVELSQPPYDYAHAMAAGRRANVDGLVLLSSPVFADGRKEILAAAVSARLPVIGFATPEAIYAVGYSANPASMARRVAEMGARILKGAKPAEIPVELAQEFDLQVNLKTAKIQGMKIPYSVLARATQLIE